MQLNKRDSRLLPMPEPIPSKSPESRPRPLLRSTSKPERRLKLKPKKKLNLRLSSSWIPRTSSKKRRKREYLWNKNSRLSQMRKTKLTRNSKKSRKPKSQPKNCTSLRLTPSTRSRSN
jgi:hypothetical protein